MIPNGPESRRETIRERILPNEQDKGKKWFSTMLHERLKDLRNNEGETHNQFKMETIAKKAGLDYDRFKKIKSMSRPTKKRDCIIAICAAAGCDVDITNDALRHYNNFPGLDEQNDRDKLIMEILDDPKNEAGVSAAEINICLQAELFAPLDVKETRKRNTVGDPSETQKYKALSIRVWTDLLTAIYGNSPRNGLEDWYNPEKYECLASADVKRVSDNKMFFLSASSNGNLKVYDDPQSIFPIISTKQLRETENFEKLFLRLQRLVSREMTSVLACCNDTKNYGARTGARFIDGAIHIFTEKYNTYIPEKGEYFLMDYAEGKYVLSCSPKSRFMELYLPKSEYRKFFGHGIVESSLECYCSLEEIETVLKEKIRWTSDYEVKLSRKKAFLSMAKEVDRIREQLVNRECFIKDLDSTFEFPDGVCHYYQLDEEFDLVFEPNAEVFVAQKESADLDFGQGNITVTLEDLERAFELGLNTAKDVYRVILEKGSIEQLLLFPNQD